MKSNPERAKWRPAARFVSERWAQASSYPSMNLHASKKGRKVRKKLGWEQGWEMRTELA